MNTIKIYLAQDGSIANLQKDFDLYQFEYQNKLLNVYVPLSICALPFVDDNITTGTSCQIKCKAVSLNGVDKITGNFYMRYVKTLTQNGVEYALFERLLPYAFTIYAGVGANAPIITISVVNISVDANESDPIVDVLSITNSQTCALEVNPSTQVQSETPQDPSDLDALFALYSAIQTDLALKQNMDTTNDSIVVNPLGDNHNVATNINKALNDSAQNTSDIGDLQSDMTQAQTDIQNLYNMVGYGVNIVGTMTTTDALPSDSDVTDFVETQTGHAVVRGQAVLVKVDYTSGTDTIYLYVYDGANWSHFEIQFLNKANNGVSGLIEGDYNANNLSIANNFMVDIVNGVIKNIYRVDADGNYTDFKTIGDQVIAKLINGTSPVKMAKEDDDGRDIVDTYMTKQDGATKTYVQDYASPRALYDLNYPDYANGEFKHENVADNSYNKTTNSASVGYTELAVLTKALEADILLGDQNSVINRVWISASATESIKLRITTAYIDSNNITQQLSVEETPSFLLTTGNAELKQIESVFSGLTTPITLPSGTTLVQTFEVWREASASVDFTLLCNTTYDSYMSLNKIGYVRYALEQEPSSVETGHDSAPTINADGDLVVSSVGEMEYANGDSQQIATILKVPMASAIDTSNLPTKSKDVKAGLDGKLTKQDGTSTYPQAYTKGVDGTQAMMDITDSTANNAIVRRNGQQVLVPQTPTANSHATSKKYVDDGLSGKLDKQTGATTRHQAYIKDADGTQTMFDVSGSVVASAVVRRDGNGDVIVPTSPTSNSGATSKDYVDTGLGGKLDKQTSATTYPQAYIKNADGTQGQQTITYGTTANTIVQRDSSSQINVPNTPIYDTSATSKKYVDDGLGIKLDKKPDGTNDLISNNKISTKYIPDEILGQLVFGGSVNAGTAVATLSTNAQSKLGTTSATIILTNDTTAITGYSANVGIYYVVATAGTFAGISYSVGDWLISIGTQWDKVDNTDEVTSVKVDTGTGLSSSTPTAQTGAVSTTISIASGYKLPTTTEWGNKLDKQAGTTTYNQAYVKNADGTQAMVNVSTGVNADHIVKRDVNSQIEVPTTPTANAHATSKSYVDNAVSGKLDKVTGTDSAIRLYGVDTSGNQTTYYAGTTNVPNLMVKRDSTGQIAVPATPSANGDATSKLYVDTQVATKISSVTPTTETWTFTLADNTQVTKTIVVGITTS